jgi:phosphatidylinositol glycan class V
MNTMKQFCPMLPIAIYSRITVLFLTFVFGTFGQSYDVSSNSSFIAWDAVYFKKLASTGTWDYEHEFAFFPGYPLLVRCVASAASTIVNVPWDSLIIVSGLAISNISFVMAVAMIYKLSKQLQMSEKICRLTALAYILNPSSVFMSSM